jgi:iron-sulfur cluster assembly protein
MTVNTYNPQAVTINLTPTALQHIEKMLNNNPQATGFRFSTKKAGCSGLSYVAELMNEQATDDLPVSNAKQLKIYVTKASAPHLNGLTVDYVKKSLGQAQFEYQNPNETGRCGCGVSFTTK